MRNLAVAMYAEGNSIKAISRLLGMKAGTVYSWVKKGDSGRFTDVYEIVKNSGHVVRAVEWILRSLILAGGVAGSCFRNYIDFYLDPFFSTCGKVYKCAECGREVAYPETLYRDGRCENCQQ